MSQRALDFHRSPWIGVCHLTGGGTGFIEEMMSTPGASASILEVQVPYASQALEELLGQAPEQACSSNTARQLAMSAYQRAQQLSQSDTIFGLGCTASLATNRTKKGQHRAHWALQTANQSVACTARYDADRAAEESLLVDQMWQSLAHVLLDAPLPADVEIVRTVASDAEASLLTTTSNRVLAGGEQVSSHELLLPGSFNPLHAGHQQMLKVGEALTGLTGAFEMTVRNADKPSLDFITLAERTQQFSAHPLWLTNTATYAEKASLFPGTTFLLGVDTMARIAQLRFYDGRVELFDKAMQIFIDAGTRFVVFGRKDKHFVALAELDLPGELAQLCDAVPEEQFRMDVSSTGLRQGKNA